MPVSHPGCSGRWPPAQRSLLSAHLSVSPAHQLSVGCPATLASAWLHFHSEPSPAHSSLLLPPRHASPALLWLSSQPTLQGSINRVMNGVRRGELHLMHPFKIIWRDMADGPTNLSWTSLVWARSCSSPWCLLSLVAWCSFCSCCREPRAASTWPWSSSFCWINSFLASRNSPSSWKVTNIAAA